MKTFLLALLTMMALPAFAQIDEAWKVDLSNVSEADHLWPEQRVERSPVVVNSREMNIDMNQVSRLHSYDKERFLELAQKFGKKDDDRIFISLDGADKTVLSLAAAASLGLIVLKGDDDLMDIVQSHKSEDTKKLAAFGYQMGRKEGLLPIVAGAYFLGVVFDNGKLKDVGIISVGAQFAAQMLVEVLKEVSGRDRPREENGPYSFNVDGGKSFISGHAAGAFSLATLLTEIYGDDYKFVPYVAYGVAAITAWSRMHDMGHWGSDVILGAVAGHIITRIVYRLQRGPEIPESERNLYIQPYMETTVEGFGPFERRRDEMGIRLHFSLQRP
ncbi:MAG: phosphatase PAP2 family protein [Bdellovibrionota bacterium]